jgi:hypothetical protein
MMKFREVRREIRICLNNSGNVGIGRFFYIVRTTASCRNFCLRAVDQPDVAVIFSFGSIKIERGRREENSAMIYDVVMIK